MKNNFNVKTIDIKVIEVEGKLVNKPKVSKAPVWFVAFEKRVDQRFGNIENILKEHDKKFEKIEGVLEKHSDIFKRNNLK